eukprot:6656800-Pyramimonas_sp.AAC.1
MRRPLYSEIKHGRFGWLIGTSRAARIRSPFSLSREQQRRYQRRTTQIVRNADPLLAGNRLRGKRNQKHQGQQGTHARCCPQPPPTDKRRHRLLSRLRSPRCTAMSSSRTRAFSD